MEFWLFFYTVHAESLSVQSHVLRRDRVSSMPYNLILLHNVECSRASDGVILQASHLALPVCVSASGGSSGKARESKPPQ